MIITKIEQQKKNDKRCSIYIDNMFAFGLSKEDVLYLKLVKNTELSKERFDYISEYIVFSKAKDKAYRFLGYKARTKKELEDKLKKDGTPEKMIEDIIKMLEGYGYINDEGYARGHIKDRVNSKPMSKRMLKYELLKKGVDESTTVNVLENSNIDEDALATELLRKKIRPEKELDKKEKERLYGYLLRRGFDYDTVNRAFNVVVNEEFNS